MNTYCRLPTPYIKQEDAKQINNIRDPKQTKTEVTVRPTLLQNTNLLTAIEAIKIWAYLNKICMSNKWEGSEEPPTLPIIIFVYFFA